MKQTQQTTGKENSHAQQGGNLFNKYESKNPLLKVVMKQFLRKLDSMVYGTTILDVGCGEGYVTHYIHKRRPHAKITAVDASQDIIELAQKLHPGITYKVASGEKLPFAEKSFDAVIASELLEHLTNPSQAIKECNRVAREVVIFSVPREPWFRLANVARGKYLSRLGNTPGHINNWTPDTFKQLLLQYFNSVHITTSAFWTIAQCKNPKEDSAVLPKL